MIIKELEISGFKSFAVRTRVRFDHEITAIVGPNGCGKSNILDALKWVTGEKSVKSIRGEKMEDVIFSGTEHKKAASYAEVILVLNNKDRVFSLDSDEVRIGRRLYRDGQSHYLLNDKKVTRREIELQLMDTGLGKSSYSFMEQGRMDQILSSKPEERRLIFEEAAGISRFKAQKEDAEKNLESTQVNMTRLNDIIRELERQMDVKKQQAAKTEVYNKLLSEQKEHDLKIRYLTLNEIDKKLEEIQEKLGRRQGEREKANQKVIIAEQQLETMEADRRKFQEQLHEKDVLNQVSREKISQWEQNMTGRTGRKELLQGEIANLKNQLTSVEGRVSELRKEVAGQNQLTLELTNQLEAAVGLKRQIEKDLENTENEIKAARAGMEKADADKEQNLKILRESRGELTVVIEDLLQSLKTEKSAWQKQQTQFQNLSDDLEKLWNQVEQMLSSKNAEGATGILASQPWRAMLSEMRTLGGGLHHIFEQGGIHSRKEELDETISSLEKKNEQLEKEKHQLSEKIQWLLEKQTSFAKKSEAVTGDIRNFELQQKNVKEREEVLREQIGHEEKQLNFFRERHNAAEKDLLGMEEEDSRTREDIRKLSEGIKKEISQIETLEKNIGRLDKKKEELTAQIRSEKEKSQNLLEVISDLEIKAGTYLGSREAMVQDIYNDYNLTFDEIAEQLGRMRVQIDDEKSRLSEIRRKIEELGPINPLAIEELKAISEMHSHNVEQRQDILDAREQIYQVIREIQKKSEDLFSESFGQIQQNFRQAFQKLFRGGEVELTLTEPEKPLESGIDIQVTPPGKKPKSLRLLSGGEKALTAIALMFGIYMVKSSPFCVLDEIDAPLDDANVNRFLELLTDFSRNTQFALITHNKKTMSKAQSIFGVTMEEPGVSKLISVELKSA